MCKFLSKHYRLLPRTKTKNKKITKPKANETKLQPETSSVIYLPLPVRSVLLLRGDLAGSPPTKLGMEEATLAGRCFLGALFSLILTGLGMLEVIEVRFMEDPMPGTFDGRWWCGAVVDTVGVDVVPIKDLLPSRIVSRPCTVVCVCGKLMRATTRQQTYTQAVWVVVCLPTTISSGEGMTTRQGRHKRRERRK